MQDDTAQGSAGGPPLLEDGTYDALVVDVSPVGEGSARLDLTIVAGRHKGEVVPVRASGLAGDPLDMLGMPAVLTVTDGQPAVTFDDN
jgi:hypothetical protein